MELLISGANRGLGKHLHRHQKSDGFVRGDNIPLNKEYDAVIHCAVSTVKDVSHKNLEAYIDDNISLTKRLCLVPTKKFIYISSVDVYPATDDNYRWRESDEIVLSTSPPTLSLYATTKLISEAAVMNCSNWLILRCSNLLDPYSRPNSSIKTLDTTRHWDVFVSGSTTSCFVLSSDIAKFIDISIRDDITGVYNVLGSDYVDLFTVSKFVGSDITFGDYTYHLGRADNSKVCEIAPFFNKGWKRVVEEFRMERCTRGVD